MPISKSSLKPPPKPSVVVTMPSSSFWVAVLISTLLSEMPTLGCPSVSSNTRLSFCGSKWALTCLQPSIQPPDRLVRPPVLTLRMSALSAALSNTFCGAIMVVTLSSNTTTDRVSPASSESTTACAACRAWRSGAPDMLPERSITKDKLSRRRGLCSTSARKRTNSSRVEGLPVGKIACENAY